jgi:glucan 1,3-beta-glucosidase
MVTQNGVSLAKYSDNVDVFPDNIALFQLASASGGPTTVSSPPTSTTSTSTSPPGTTLTTKTSTSSSSAPTSSGWTFLGCYTDSVSARTLSQRFDVAGGASAMTIEACKAVCHSNGYSLAGVEYADECCK